MEQGFIKDATYGAAHVSTWVEGTPEKSFWTGTKTHGRKQLPVKTYRCSACGYLESFATLTSGAYQASGQQPPRPAEEG
jgi:ribosomal protein L37E